MYGHIFRLLDNKEIEQYIISGVSGVRHIYEPKVIHFFKKSGVGSTYRNLLGVYTVNKMTKFLWTGESEYCQCGHHITKHSTRNNWLNIWESNEDENEPNYLCYGSRGMQM